MNLLDEEKIKVTLGLEYRIKPDIFEKSAWGYNTVAYYAKEKSKSYIVKLTTDTHEKMERCKKDVIISKLLNPFLPTPEYVRNVRHEYVTIADSCIMRVARYVAGTSPFEMDFSIYQQIMQLLFVLHEIPIEKLWPVIKGLNLERRGDSKQFLHGDLTPSNVIVADDKIVGVLDFEDSLLGPVEYDLARSAVFCWFRMKNIGFKEVFEYTCREYPRNIVTKDFLTYCLDHAQNHLDQVVSNKPKYTDEVFWTDDYNFSSQALTEISRLSIKSNID